MKTRRKGSVIHTVVNLAVLLLAAYFVCRLFAGYDREGIVSPRLFLAFVIIVLILHFIKMSRLFLIMLEQKIRPAAFISLYAGTAFVNLAIPFKLGEVFRFYCLSREAGYWKVGLLAVAIDRFFDTIALLTLLIPLELVLTTSLSLVTMLLIAFAILCVVIYTAFPSVYNYLNRFLILNTNSRRSVKALAALEGLYGWYADAQSLMKGRLAVIIVLSAVAWGVEYCALYLLAHSMNGAFVPGDFITYINSIFYRSNLELSYFYFALSGAILAAVALLFSIISRIKKENPSHV
jgi:hypothetical protein